MRMVTLKSCFIAVLLAAAGAHAGEAGVTDEQIERLKKCNIEVYITRYYVDWDTKTTAVGAKAVAAAAEVLGEDPAAVYFTGFAKAGRSRELATRAEAIRTALKTEQVSLSFAAMLWRDLAEVCLDGKPAAERTAEERRVLADTLAALEIRSREWQERTFKEKLGAFLFKEVNSRVIDSRGSAPAYVSILDAVGTRRWGKRLDQVTADYTAAHPFGESMQIAAACDATSGVTAIRAGKPVKLEAGFRMGVFDIIETPGKAGDGPVALALSDHDLNLIVKLPAGCQLGYADILRLAYEQNRAALDAKVSDRWSWPLALPAWRAAAGEGAKPSEADTAKRVNALIAELGSDDYEKREAASKALRNIGEPALEPLKLAKKSPDAEIRSRAATLVDEIGTPDAMVKEARMRLISLWLF